MRLIDADAIPTVSADPYEEAGFRGTIEDMPTIDPVKHGKWVINLQGNWACSLCGNDPYHDNMENMNYCPNCGARMDL